MIINVQIQIGGNSVPRRIIRKMLNADFKSESSANGLIEWITAAGYLIRIILQICPDCLCSCTSSYLEKMSNHNIGSFQMLSFEQKKTHFFFFLLPHPRCMRTIGPHHHRLAATCACAHEWAYIYP